ncbi:MAG: [Fe-Fe] hydrogenase large subunit C-terminal domain-containing protein [Bacilli bacterium]
MENILGLKKSNCKNCYKCIRHCPVKSIRFEENQAHIIKDECILCGMCFAICPQDAKAIRNDVGLVRDAIAEGKKVIATLAPSFVANYENSNLTSITSTLKSLGFADVVETSVGAKVVKDKYDELVNSNEHDILISTCCHSVILLIEKYYPELVKYLAEVKSPMQVSGDLIAKENPGAFIVFIGPCISKKDEIEKVKTNIDVVLTFEELDSWFKEDNIKLAEIPEDKLERSKTRLFPTTGGILKTMACNNSEFTYMAIDGMENCMKALDDITHNLLHNVFIEMSSCAGSCINGPSIIKEHQAPIKDFIRISKYAGSADYLIDKDIVETKKEFKYLGTHKSIPSEKDIEDILQRMGKITKEKELNCGSCGYPTCRDKAVAIFQGKAMIEMCLPFLQEKAQSFSDNIIKITPNGILVLNEKLHIELANKAMCDIFCVSSQQRLVGKDISEFINPGLFATVLNEKRQIKARKMHLDRQNKYVEMSVSYDEDHHIIILLVRDITEETNEKTEKDLMIQRTIEITNNVVQKQMTAVQEIASLLGESTAETKVALINLKDSLENGK